MGVEVGVVFRQQDELIPVRTWQSQTQEGIHYTKPLKLHLLMMHILATDPSSIQD